MSPASNANCYPCNMTNNLQQQQQSYWPSLGRGPCFQPNLKIIPPSKPMGCSPSFGKENIPIPLCFPTPVVYTPEMETLFSSGGIIYARKSGIISKSEGRYAGTL
jgi:hypothetical protein